MGSLLSRDASNLPEPKPRDDNPFAQEPADGEEAPQLPQPCPPPTRKMEIFNKHLFTQIDKAATSVPTTVLNDTYEELAFYITSTCTNDLERVRALFMWITSFEVGPLLKSIGKEPVAGSPLEYLWQIKRRKGNKAHLFSHLCLAAGLPCVLITGINKSSAYELGSPIDKALLTAQWNAVLVDNQWRLVDPFWGSACSEVDTSKDWMLLGSDRARPKTTESAFRTKSTLGFSPSIRSNQVSPLPDDLRSQKSPTMDDSITTAAARATVIDMEVDEDEYDSTQHLVNEFFFLTDPHMLVSTHLPDHRMWQMLEEPITLERFSRQAYLRDRFFELDARLIDKSLHDCVNKTKTGEIDFIFGIPSAAGQFLHFAYLIYQERGPMPPEDYPLERYVFYQKLGDTVKFSVQFPVSGRFKIDLYGRHTLHHDALELIAAYIVDATAKEDAQPLPDMPEIGWGPGPEMEDAGLEADQKEAVIETHDGTVELRFNKTNPLSVLQAMKNNHLDDWLLQRVAVLREEGDEVVVNIRLPEPGEYGFKLYADDPEHEGQLSNICNYLLKSVNPKATPDLFPPLYNGVLGAAKHAKAMGVEAASHPEGRLETEDGRLRLVFDNPPDTELLLELTSDKYDPDVLAQSITRTEENGQTVFEVALPDAGEFGINVFGQNKDADRRKQATIQHVHSYLATSTQREKRVTPAEQKQQQQEADVAHKTMKTSRESLKVDLPDGDFEHPLVASLQRQQAQDPLDHDAVKRAKRAGDDVFQARLPELGHYDMNIYQKTPQGALKAVSVVHIERHSPVPGEEEEDDEDAVERKLAEAKYAAELKTLRSAVKAQDPDRIKAAVNAIRSRGDVPDSLKKEVEDAENLADYLRHKEALNSAMGKNSIADLEKAIADAESASPAVCRKLDAQLKLARKMLEQLRRIAKLLHDILELNQRTIAEIRSFASPPVDVFRVMRATFIILGESETVTKEWKSLQALIGKTGKQSLKRRVGQYDHNTMTVQTLKQCNKILKGLNKEMVQAVSAGAATFYVWAEGMMAEADYRFSQAGIDTS